jgi:hypothetical protein
VVSDSRYTASIPPLHTVKDNDVRRVLEALVSGWRARNGDLKPESDERFITKGELQSLIDASNAGYFAHGAEGYNLIKKITATDDLLERMQRLLEQVRSSDLFEVLSTRIKLVDDRYSVEILGLQEELDVASQQILDIENGVTDIAIVTDAGTTTIRGLKDTVYDPNSGLASAQAAIGEINRVSTTSTSAIARQVASVVAQVNDPNTGLPLANANITAINDVRAESNSANARALAGVQATITDPDTGLEAAHASIVELNDVSADSNSANARFLFSVNATTGQKNKVFFQEDAPTSTAQYALRVNDIWFNSGNKNRPSMWDGSQWVDAADARINDTQALITEERNVRTNSDNALASAVNTLWSTVGDNSALVQSGAEGIVNNVGAVATRWDQVQTAITDPDTGLPISSAAIREEATVTADKVGTLEGQYTVKIDLNGYVSGFGLASTASNASPTSDFIVRADTFSIVNPSGNESTVVMTNNRLVVYDEGGRARVILGNLS